MPEGESGVEDDEEWDLAVLHIDLWWGAVAHLVR
jgi:hypothetical protein